MPRLKFIDPDGDKVEFEANRTDAWLIVQALVNNWDGEEVVFGFQTGLVWKEIANSKSCDLAMIEFKSILMGDKQ